MRGMAREYAAGNSLGPGWHESAGDLRLSGGWVGRRRCRQAGSGMARSRAKARLNFSAQGQRSGFYAYPHEPRNVGENDLFDHK